MKKITALALALLLALSLCACGGAKEDQSLLGTYTLYAMEYEKGTNVLASEVFDGESYINLKSGGSAEFCLEGDVANVKWKADAGKITVIAADGEMSGSIADGLLTLDTDDSKLFFTANEAAKGKVKALTLNELLSGAVSDVGGSDAPAATEAPKDEPKDEPTPTEAPKPAAPAEPTELQQKWNGWYFGCIDMHGCTGEWEYLNGETFDVTMYVELGADASGRLIIYDPFAALVQNETNNLIANAWCHADDRYLYADSGLVFGCDIQPVDWVMVHNLAIPEKLNMGSETTNEEGETVGYDFQFKPWGDRWEGDNYTKFIPYFDQYIAALDSGLASPFGDSFPGLDIAHYPIPGVNGAASSGGNTETPAEQPTSGGSGGGNSALLGADPVKLDINDRGIVYVYYPGDQFSYNADYGKIKNDDTGVGILFDPMLGAGNLAELKASYEKNNSDEQDYSLVETTVNGYKAIIMKYSDWLGSTMRVDIDFGGSHDGYYGMSFAVSGDSLADCDTDLVWAIINSMELAK